MIDTKDIVERITEDFGEKAGEVLTLIEQAISEASHLDSPRIIRCILFLSDKDISRLTRNIAAAIADPRDVMYWAEYSDHGAENPKRLRDFSKPFNEAEQSGNL